MPPILARTSMKQKLKSSRSSPLFLGHWLTVSCHSINKEQKDGKCTTHRKHREKNNTTLPQGPRSSFRLSMEKDCKGAVTAVAMVAVGLLPTAFNLFLLYAHSTSTASNINQISGSHTVTIYCLLSLREEWEWCLWRGQQRDRANVGQTLLQMLSHLLLSQQENTWKSILMLPGRGKK